MSRVIFKILKAVKGFPGIGYNERKVKKGKAKLVYYGNFPYHDLNKGIITEKDAKSYLELVSAKNKKIKFSQFHAIVSSKDKQTDQNEMLRIGLGIMEKMGYSQNPTLAYLHTDTKHNHLHIVSTRVDPNGRKISDKFEGIKANNILNDLLQLDYEQKVANDIKDAQSYHGTTMPQYILLFELKGYRVKNKDQHLELYKYGKLIKNVPVKGFESPMERPFKNDTNRMRALIFKYQQIYSSVLEDRKQPTYENKNGRLHSELTDFLHQRLGIQFVFFKAKDHEMPYGYSIIDHKNKTIYKGSEVMKLQLLLGEETLESPKTNETVNNNKSFTENPDINNPNFDPEKLKQKYIPEVPIEANINRIENEVEKDLSKEHVVPRRRRGRFI